MAAQRQEHLPLLLEAIEYETEQLGFSMASDRSFGSLLRSLAAAKPGGRLLELGTGTGLSAAWLLDGMDESAELITVENDSAAAAVASKYLGADPRVKIHVEDAVQLLEQVQGQKFDLIFADTWVGKFERLEEVLSLLSKGGLYIIDDLLPQPNWPEGHARKVSELEDILAQQGELFQVWLSWSTGIMIGTRK